MTANETKPAPEPPRACKCLRCDHAWWRIIPGWPKACPVCHSRYWWIPRGVTRLGRPPLAHHPLPTEAEPVESPP